MRLARLAIAVTVLGIVLLPALAFAQTSQRKASAEDGLLAWSAFECSMYASLAQEPQSEFARLFSLGYEGGKRFLEGVLSKEISEDSVSKKVPIGLIWNAQGPTVDFRLGRIYEVSTQEAYDRVVKHDPNGLDLAVAQWRTDKELKKSIAAREYRDRNCALLK